MTTGYFPQDVLSPVPSTPNTPAPVAGQRSNALLSRITTVLSASYADLDIRDALETLDARGVKNSQETRRQLRLDVQKEVIQCNGEIVQDFGQVAEQLKHIGTVITSLNRCCAQMREYIAAANRDTAPVLEETTALLYQKVQVETKQSILEAFNAHFIVSEDDLTTLTSTAEPVNDDFFRILNRVKKVHQDSQVLLGTENQRLGLEILEQSSKHLNGAFQKLYRWIQREFKTLDLENPQINASIRRALRVLAERPPLFQNCLDFFAEAREHILSDSFYTALTGQSKDNHTLTTKPIEFYSHDPLRYVGDMLAWAHSVTVSEREALEVLFISEGDEIAKGIQAGLESDPWSRGEDDEPIFDGRKALGELVSRDLAGVARLLRQRIEQVIHTHEDPTLAYKLANLIGFYKSTFTKLIGDDSPLLDVLGALEDSAFRQFRANMRDHVAAVQTELAHAPPNFAPPDFLEEALETLKALMKSYDTSLAAVDSREAGFQPVLAEALDPFLNGCENLQNGLEAPGNSIFAINCIISTKNTLSPFSFTSEKVTDLEESLEEHSSRLAEYQHAFFLGTSGLYPLIEALSPLSESPEDLAKIPNLEPFKPAALTATSQTLDDFLLSALEDAKENIKALKDIKMVQKITEDAAKRFCEDFEYIKNRLLSADELRDDEDEEDEMDEPRLRDLFPRTSVEIRVLLS
ncbi:oligomeric Golgi complex subunit 6 [Patellaria atrata CBS 101060]|uniref:Conserved oligomeric Golgi complex subunit 6 n=1 Tax=Patellaria atrata CBS 101060 TaxID=1346257 RepID=A0A9P4S3V2_9PEZI|nr:oligomeric Golgi complex subunit 6 [Patellaria atrata CBS 101060]